MLYFYLIIIGLLTPVSSFADVTETQYRSFLKSREVIEQVYFETSSRSLSPDACRRLDLIVPRLLAADSANALFRVEGFSSPDGKSKSNVSLSMYRALSVRDYLREKHDLKIEVFLTGFVAINSSGSREESRRVDIALYQKPAEIRALFEGQGSVEKIIVK